MLKIQIDTCFLAEAIIRRNQDFLEEFIGLYNQHAMGMIQIVLPKAIQAEFYGILRAGRMKKRTGNYFLTHQQIMQLTSDYPAIFNMDYLNTLDAYEWPEGKDGDVARYKHTFKKVIEDEYGWNDWGEEYIEQSITRKIIHTNIRRIDIYDFPIMATALLHSVHIILTENLKDFSIPTGQILVFDLEKLKQIEDISEVVEHLLDT